MIRKTAAAFLTAAAVAAGSMSVSAQETTDPAKAVHVCVHDPSVFEDSDGVFYLF